MVFDRLRLFPSCYRIAIGVGNRNGIPEAVQFEITSSPAAAETRTDIFLAAFVTSATISAIDLATARSSQWIMPNLASHCSDSLRSPEALKDGLATSDFAKVSHDGSVGIRCVRALNHVTHDAAV